MPNISPKAMKISRIRKNRQALEKDFIIDISSGELTACLESLDTREISSLIKAMSLWVEKR